MSIGQQKSDNGNALVVLTSNDDASSKLAVLQLRLEELNRMQEQYLAFLNATKKLVLDLNAADQSIKDELAKIEARGKLADYP